VNDPTSKYNVRFVFASLVFAFVAAAWVAPAGASPLLAPEQQLMDLINQARTDHGVGILSLSDQLRTAALDHSLDMAQSGILTHTGSGGSNYVQRVQASGYAGSPFIPFELIAFAGGGTPLDVLNLFLSDSAHGAPLLAPSVFDVGVGNAQNYWTVLLNPVQFTPVNNGGSPGNSGTGGTGGTPLQPLAVDPSVCTGVLEPEARALCLVNDVRTREGHAALVTNDELAQAAAGHAQDMLTNNFFGHTGSNGSDLVTRTAASGYDGIAVGELLGQGFLTADDLVQAWLDDGLHRDILLEDSASEVGIDFRQGESRALWDMLLAAPGSAQVPEPTTFTLLVVAFAGVSVARRNKPN